MVVIFKKFDLKMYFIIHIRLESCSTQLSAEGLTSKRGTTKRVQTRQIITGVETLAARQSKVIIIIKNIN